MKLLVNIQDIVWISLLFYKIAECLVSAQTPYYTRPDNTQAQRTGRWTCRQTHLRPSFRLLFPPTPFQSPLLPGALLPSVSSWCSSRPFLLLALGVAPGLLPSASLRLSLLMCIPKLLLRFWWGKQHSTLNWLWSGTHCWLEVTRLLGHRVQIVHWLHCAMWVLK